MSFLTDTTNCPTEPFAFAFALSLRLIFAFACLSCSTVFSIEHIDCLARPREIARNTLAGVHLGPRPTSNIELTTLHWSIPRGCFLHRSVVKWGGVYQVYHHAWIITGSQTIAWLLQPYT